MLATFMIEIIGALYILWRYKLTATSRLIVSILICLAAFQGAEYMLCGGMGVTGGRWSQLGYSAITLLPPLGIHLAMTLAKKKNVALLTAAYGSAVFFVGYFTFYTAAISGHTCYANYVVFDGSQSVIPMIAYAAYYYGWLIVGTGLSLYFASQKKLRKVRPALHALAAGYAAFIVPTTAINIADPSTVAGIPSIMCGFAVLLALVLIAKVAPESLYVKNSPRSLRIRY